MVTLFSEKMVISYRWMGGFMPNLIKKSVTVAMYRNSNLLFVFTHENFKKLPYFKKIKEKFRYCPDCTNGPKLHFCFYEFDSKSISLLFILDYTKRKLLHVNFKVVDSQKKTSLCMPALTIILLSKSIWIGWNNIILFFFPNFKLINCKERQKIERGICHGIKRGVFLPQNIP